MPNPSIKQRTNQYSDLLTAKESKVLFDALRTEIVTLRTALTGVTAKLDADAGVTDTDYASLHDPAAIGIDP